MSINWEHCPERNLTIFVAGPKVDVADILQAYRDAKERHGLTKHTIWDGRQASVAHFTPYDLERLNQMLALIQGNDRSRQGGRAALVLTSPHDATVFADFVTNDWRLPQQRKVVFSLEEAHAWLEEDG